MAARREQDAMRRAEKKPALIVENTLPRSFKESMIRAAARGVALWFQGASSNALKVIVALWDLWDRVELQGASEARGVALWDEAVESLGRSAGVLEELVESTGEAIARFAAGGDRIDRVQKDTRALLTPW
jgi:hypothetical protein